MIREKEKHTANSASLLEGNDETIKFLGRDFTILKNVFSPKRYPSTKWFSKELSKIIRNKEIQFLEMGCGSGMISIYLGAKNRNTLITSADINKTAIKNTKQNIKEYSLEKKITTIESDVFSNIKNKFDMIFWAMPFGYLTKNKKITILEKSVFDPDYKDIRKFIKDAKAHLTYKGRLLIGFSKDIGNYNLLKRICKREGFSIKLISKTEFIEGKYTIGMEIYELVLKL